MNTLPNPLLVAIVDDRPISVQNLTRILSEPSDIQLLFTATDSLSVPKKIAEHGCPHVVLLDVEMPGMSGYNTAHWLREHHPEVHVIALSYYTDRDMIMRMLHCGALGFLPKESASHEIHLALREVVKQGILVNEYVSAEMWNRVHARNEPYEVENLTARERELLVCLSSNDTYERIAGKMNLSVHTVKRYASELNHIFGVQSRAALVSEARRLRLIPTDWNK